MENTPAVIAPTTIAELFADDIQNAYKNDQLNLLLNNEPKREWVKVHPFVKDYRYIPIDKIEYLLRKIFKRYRIEIKDQGTAFNGVWVTVRVHFWNPVINDFDYHDGIGACQLQTKSGTSPADLININNGAISMAFPIAKTVAIKDACDHFGKLFGCDLNRKDTIPFHVDNNVTVKASEIDPEIQDAIDSCNDINALDKYVAGMVSDDNKWQKHLGFRTAVTKRKKQLEQKQ